jgi:hypothetical protein
MGSSGTMMAPLDEFDEHFVITFGFNIYVTVFFIAGQAGYAEEVGHLFGRGAEENALHFAVNRNVIVLLHVHENAFAGKALKIFWC